jgi:competence protein ComFC
MLKAISDSLFALLYPQACHICSNISERVNEGVACTACWEKTRIFSGRETLCDKCGDLLNEQPGRFDVFCHQCDEHFYDRARSAGVYESGLSASVLYLKQTPRLSKKAQKLFIEAFQSSPFHDLSCVIPVPLSRRRRLERGFNQAAILAGILAKKGGLALEEEVLIRKVHTPVHRAAMDKKARDLTVRNAFEVVKPDPVKDKNVLLVDDVFTSGATASYCAKVLKKSGAGKVYVFTLARAV